MYILNSNFDFSKLWDINSYILPIIGYIVVFIALLFLVVIFLALPKLININIKNALRKQGKISENDNGKEDYSIPGDVVAAISLALHLHYDDTHDMENAILTMKRVSRTYSPWSSKLYGLRDTPEFITRNKIKINLKSNN